MNLYKVRNLHVLHLELKIQFTFVLEGQYLVVSKHSIYTTFLTEHDIYIYMATQS